MAQAARLSLRMQKELKLLLTDPPPGVSLPLLSANSDSSNLSTIDAQIDGPEGTVYAKGVFNVKILIPDRYPFQPPIVTFATPVYHPNIDNGGRICLDILNLPPKGAWQPSLNISTVLTSLGLLLSEPNPDDGLMCEASREYKYNRQAFDQKARSMTEQFAMAGSSMNHSHGVGSGSMSCNTNPSTIQAEGSETECKSMVNESSLSHKKLQVCWKLSLQSSGLSQQIAADKKEAAMAVDHDVHKPRKDQVTEGENGSEKGIFRKPCGIRRKLSLESSGLSQRRDAYDSNRLSIDQQLPSKNHCAALSEPLEMPQVDNLDEKSHHDRKGADSGITKICKKLGKISQGTSLNSSGSKNRMDDDKENMEPVHRLLVSHSQSEGLSPLNPSNPQPEPQCANCDEQDNGDQNIKVSNATINVCPKQVYNAGANVSLESLGSLRRRDDEEEENQVLLPPHSQRNGISPKSTSHTFNSNGQHQHHEAKFVNSCIKQQEEDISPVTEAVIVLDSEDSEEENRGLKRSRLSLARKRPTKAKT